jgi:hypothetical protein
VAPGAAGRRGLSTIPARLTGVWPWKGGGRVYGSPALGFAGWRGARRLRQRTGEAEVTRSCTSFGRCQGSYWGTDRRGGNRRRGGASWRAGGGSRRPGVPGGGGARRGPGSWPLFKAMCRTPSDQRTGGGRLGTRARRTTGNGLLVPRTHAQRLGV